MYKVNILASDNSLFSTVFGSFDMLMQAGVFWNIIHGNPPAQLFSVQITSSGEDILNGIGDTKIIPHRPISQNDEFDLIIIPSEGMNIQVNSPSFVRRTDYILSMHNKGAKIASICTGAFVLAATGLLDGKVATTHWAMGPLFKSLFPKVDLDTTLLIVDNEDILTSGGVSADQDLCMHLISKMCGREIALQTSRCTLVESTSRKQSPFRSFVINKQHGDSEVLTCQRLIETMLTKDISVDYLAKQVSLSRRTFDRRFKIATGYSANQYMQQLKVEKAKYILERERTSFDHLTFRLGYENTSYFRRLFKKFVGVSPKEYRRLFYRPLNQS